VDVLTHAQHGGQAFYDFAMTPSPAIELLGVALALLLLLVALYADTIGPSSVMSVLYLLLAAGGLVLLVVAHLLVFTTGQSYIEVSPVELVAALVVLYAAYAAMLAGGIVLARSAWTRRREE
jgi:hypothetical protein